MSFYLTYFSNNKKQISMRDEYNIWETQKTMEEKIKNILIILFLYIFDYLLLYFIK